MQKTAAVESPVSANDATAVAALAMDKEEMMQWLRTILNREPETNDLYAVVRAAAVRPFAPHVLTAVRCRPSSFTISVPLTRRGWPLCSFWPSGTP